MEREQTTLRLPAELLSKLREEAQERGLSFNSYAIECFERRERATPIQREERRSPSRTEQCIQQ